MRTFALSTLLTVTTGRLLTQSRGPNDNGIGDLHELLGWMTNDTPFTHQLGRFSNECKPWLLRWFPELDRVNETDFKLLKQFIAELGPEDGCTRFVEAVQTLHGLQCSYDVGQIPADDHTVKNAYDELVEMRGSDDGIIVIQTV